MARRPLSSQNRQALSSRKDEPDDTLTVAEIDRYAKDWLQDGKIRTLSKQTLATRRLLLDKFLWYLRDCEI